MAADWNLSSVCMAFSEAAQGSAEWQHALEVASDHLGAVGAVIVPLKGSFTKLQTTPSFKEAIDAYIGDGWVDRDIRFKGVGTMRKKRVATDLDFISPDLIRHHPYYQDWLRPFGLKWFAGVHVAGVHDEWALSIQRSEDQGPFNEEEVARLRLLSQGISSVVAVGSALGFAKAEAALEAFEISGRAVVMLDRQGDVVLINQAAERLVCGDLQISRKRLVCRDATATRALGAAIHAVCSREPGSDLLHPISIARPNSAPIIAFVTPARGGAIDLLSPCQTLVVLFDPIERKAPPPELLQKLFHLTPAESRLAHALANGHKLHDLSIGAGLSYETVRNQLKSIFVKLGVNSQTDMVAALVSIVVPLGFL
ncbi:helix-turn-helix transcriptional regulator [Rhizobium sp. 2YAF20]|uniref:helix-turn-helix transcriptional regulator n=1 Tax=Rhizobium sp. 2YAF20 TaxID=3233027 RepID=UPI003F9A55C8